MELPAVHAGLFGRMVDQDSQPTLRSGATNSELTAADWWFARLDQRPFTVGEMRWTMQVLGVHVDGFHTWIQIEFAEDADSSLLLHLTPWAGLQDAIDIVRAEMSSQTSSGVAADSRCLGECHNVMVPAAAIAAGQPD